jgi:hypothetical protein
MMFDRKFLQFGLKPFPRLQPDGAPRKTLRTILIRSESAEFLELVDRGLCINRQGQPPLL